MNGLKIILFLFVSSLLFISCRKTHDSGKLLIQFEHRVNGQPLVKDQMIYTNAVGNHYEIHGLKYFISDVKLHRHDGSVVAVSQDNPAHYVDIDLPLTFS